ncbi:hypothetical protein SUGI_0075020 [Cryptomeria japonica]|nr:hypothetical protein SUGI_0075020 [Cryptomeria japonica]
MSSLLKKRSREDEALLDSSVKRFHGESEQKVLDILEEIENEGKFQEDENCTASEEVLNGVMKSLEAEIGLTACSTSYEGFGDEFVASDTTSRHDIEGKDSGEIDLDFLLGASDDELGIPPSPLQNLEKETVSSNSKEDFGLPLDLAENTELNKGFIDNWRFEEDLVEYGQFGMFEDPAAFDPLSQAAFLDGDYSPQWRFEAAGVMY